MSREILYGGIRFNPPGNYDGNFEKTEANWYLQNYFVPQMMQCYNFEKDMTRGIKDMRNQAMSELSAAKVQYDNQIEQIKSKIKPHADARRDARAALYRVGLKKFSSDQVTKMVEIIRDRTK